MEQNAQLLALPAQQVVNSPNGTVDFMVGNPAWAALRLLRLTIVNPTIDGGAQENWGIRFKDAGENIIFDLNPVVFINHGTAGTIQTTVVQLVQNETSLSGFVLLPTALLLPPGSVIEVYSDVPGQADTVAVVALLSY
jgi:hypothetical protein